MTPGPRPGGAMPLPESVRLSRWKGSQTTFGPVGRLVLTVALLLPVVFFWFAGMFWLGGIIYVFVLLPWAMRDLWRRTRVRQAPVHRG
jgi:hypothetical protein